MALWDSIANLATSASQSSSGGVSGSQNRANNWSASDSQSIANTWGSQASAKSAEEAEKAHQRQIELMKMAQEYNSKEAQKARDWEENMANTIYTRSVKNMEEAGINPILAAGFGLSAGSVGSGSTASIGTPSTFMGNTYADSNSASTSTSRSQGTQEGNTWGSQWAQQTSGLSTFLNQMGLTIDGVKNMINGGATLANVMDGLDFGDNPYGTEMAGGNFGNLKDIVGKIKDVMNGMMNEKYNTEHTPSTMSWEFNQNVKN